MTAFEKYGNRISMPNTANGLKFKEAVAEIWNVALVKANSSVQLFQINGISYSWQPLAEFSQFELAIFHRTVEKDEWDELSPQTIYVNGDKSKLERILAVWNESKNFRYEVKP